MISFEKIEFMFFGDPGELVCLWYWDWANGNDVSGVLLESGMVEVKTYNEEGEETGKEQISAVDFFKRIQATLNTRQT